MRTQLRANGGSGPPCSAAGGGVEGRRGGGVEGWRGRGVDAWVYLSRPVDHHLKQDGEETRPLAAGGAPRVRANFI